MWLTFEDQWAAGGGGGCWLFCRGIELNPFPGGGGRFPRFPPFWLDDGLGVVEDE